MGPKIVNRNKDSIFHGDYIGRDNITVNIVMFQDSEREFVVTHNANIKPVAYFTGRETELQDLRQRIAEGKKSVLVSGMGGIGKTHICRKLFEEYLNKYTEEQNCPFRHIGYIEYSGDMGSSLQNCLKFKQQEKPEQNQEAAWRELECLAADGKLLLFVDNVNMSMGQDPGLKRLMSIPGAIVLTSRRRAFSKEFEPYRIGFLSTEKCREIYEKIRYEDGKKRVSEEEVPHLEYIIDTLVARHTITIEFLAHLAWTKNWAVQDLRDELDKNKFQLEYKDEEDKLVNIQKEYEKLYDLSELSGEEQNILEAFSVFPYIPLTAETCNEWLLADAGVNEDDDILMGLYQKGWIQFDWEQVSYAMHPVFAQFILDKCKPKAKNHLGLIESCQQKLEIIENGLVLECQKYIPFAEKMIEKLGMENSLEQVSFISVVAYLFEYVAEYKKAKALYEKSLKIIVSVLGEEHPDTVWSNDRLAGMYKRKGEYKKAEELSEKNLCIMKRVYGEEHLNTAASYHNLAIVYGTQGEYEKAKELYEQSLRIMEKALGEEHPDIAKIYNNLAVVYGNQGEHEKAKELYEKSLRIKEKVLGEEHPDTAQIYNNLAVVYDNQGEHEKAEELYKKSLRIMEKVLGEEHPDTATGYNNLATVYEAQGEYEKAEELYKKSLRIREKILGEEHLDTAKGYNNLAMVYGAQGEYEKAKELYEKSLRIREKVLGEEHPDTATGYNNLATVYEAQGEYQKAMSYCFKAYNILLIRLGSDHPNTRIVLENMKETCYKWKPDGNFEQWLEEKMKEYQ